MFVAGRELNRTPVHSNTSADKIVNDVVNSITTLQSSNSSSPDSDHLSECNSSYESSESPPLPALAKKLFVPLASPPVPACVSNTEYNKLDNKSGDLSDCTPSAGIIPQGRQISRTPLNSSLQLMLEDCSSEATLIESKSQETNLDYCEENASEIDDGDQSVDISFSKTDVSKSDNNELLSHLEDNKRVSYEKIFQAYENDCTVDVTKNGEKSFIVDRIELERQGELSGTSSDRGSVLRDNIESLVNIPVHALDQEKLIDSDHEICSDNSLEKLVLEPPSGFNSPVENNLSDCEVHQSSHEAVVNRTSEAIEASHDFTLSSEADTPDSIHVLQAKDKKMYLAKASSALPKHMHSNNRRETFFVTDDSKTSEQLAKPNDSRETIDVKSSIDTISASSDISLFNSRSKVNETIFVNRHISNESSSENEVAEDKERTLEESQPTDKKRIRSRSSVCEPLVLVGCAGLVTPVVPDNNVPRGRQLYRTPFTAQQRRQTFVLPVKEPCAASSQNQNETCLKTCDVDNEDSNCDVLEEEIENEVSRDDQSSISMNEQIESISKVNKTIVSETTLTRSDLTRNNTFNDSDSLFPSIIVKNMKVLRIDEPCATLEEESIVEVGTRPKRGRGRGKGRGRGRAVTVPKTSARLANVQRLYDDVDEQIHNEHALNLLEEALDQKVAPISKKSTHGNVDKSRSSGRNKPVVVYNEEMLGNSKELTVENKRVLQKTRSKLCDIEVEDRLNNGENENNESVPDTKYEAVDNEDNVHSLATNKQYVLNFSTSATRGKKKQVTKASKKVTTNGNVGRGRPKKRMNKDPCSDDASPILSNSSSGMEALQAQVSSSPPQSRTGSSRHEKKNNKLGIAPLEPPHKHNHGDGDISLNSEAVIVLSDIAKTSNFSLNMPNSSVSSSSAMISRNPSSDGCNDNMVADDSTIKNAIPKNNAAKNILVNPLLTKSKINRTKRTVKKIASDDEIAVKAVISRPNRTKRIVKEIEPDEKIPVKSVTSRPSRTKRVAKEIESDKKIPVKSLTSRSSLTKCVANENESDEEIPVKSVVSRSGRTKLVKNKYESEEEIPVKSVTSRSSRTKRVMKEDESDEDIPLKSVIPRSSRIKCVKKDNESDEEVPLAPKTSTKTNLRNRNSKKSEFHFEASVKSVIFSPGRSETVNEPHMKQQITKSSRSKRVVNYTESEVDTPVKPRAAVLRPSKKNTVSGKKQQLQALQIDIIKNDTEIVDESDLAHQPKAKSTKKKLKNKTKAKSKIADDSIEPDESDLNIIEENNEKIQIGVAEEPKITVKRKRGALKINKGVKDESLHGNDIVSDDESPSKAMLVDETGGGNSLPKEGKGKRRNVRKTFNAKEAPDVIIQPPTKGKRKRPSGP